MKYTQIPASELPAGLRFDVPPECGGQIIEVAYGDFDKIKTPFCSGAPYKRVIDQSEGQTPTYYRRVKG